MQMTYTNPEATYATINLGEAFTVEQIKDRSIVIDGDIGEVLQKLALAAKIGNVQIRLNY